jgi:hypothetical protein
MIDDRLIYFGRDAPKLFQHIIEGLTAIDGNERF